ncbi:HlyIII-domain-containing protein [Multifurca ochricompacta]|uniref:HlyIII-domain-containing protein n=1 Tax=Multifurca ochricompacta TaxID=376703 RepID=A0AAD4QMK3_9AGAM|nr:HlyIII-domain-containing protein [Multifurca ochricompacta]
MSASFQVLQRHTAQPLPAELNPESALFSSQRKSRKHRTITFVELPEWMKDNEFILTGYRGELNSWWKCLESVFGYLHNETVNIHTHLHASILFAFFLLHTVNDSYFKAHVDISWADRAVFVVFLSSAVFCLFCSAFFHMASSHSKQVAARCNALDYSGIIALILGSCYPCLYYGFYCEPHYKVGYLLLITLAGIAAAYIVLSPEYAKPTHRHARTRVFIALGLCSVLPVSHLILSHGIHALFREMGFFWLLAAGAMYITGALPSGWLTYLILTHTSANRVPERLAPGRFDRFFSSHQIFHVFVVLAALSTYSCVLAAFEHRHSRSGMCVA